jgi:anti-sigma-K factor RskA
MDAVGGHGDARVPSRQWWARWWERVPAGRPLTVLGLVGTAAAVALALVLTVGSRAPSPVVTQPLQAGVNQPGVTGTLTYFRSSGDAVLSVRGLRDDATTPAGVAAVYELWLMRGDGRVAPAGVLNRQADGTWRAVVHRQTSAEIAIAATLEPSPGTQSPTGAQVFQSTLP